MKHLPRFAALLLTLALLGGCTPGEDPAVTPTPALSPTPAPTATAFALPYDPDGSLHPLAVTASANLSLMSLLYEGLFAVNTRFEAEPVLCQSALPNEDATLWTLTVKPGVTCSDGTPVTGDLCRTSLLAAKASPLYAQRLQGISAITADGDRLAVSLSAPNRNLPALLDVPIFSGDKTPAGTGPYLLQETRLVARSDWWQGLSLPLDTIALVKAVSPEDLIYSFDAGDIALVTGDLTGINVLGYSGNYEVLDYPTSTMLYVGFNAAKGPCKSPALRSALTLGFDRATICGSLLAGHAVASTLPVHPNADPLSGDSPLAYSLPELGKQLDALGYLKGEDGLRRQKKSPLTLTMLVNTDSGFKTNVAEFLADTLSREGVTVALKKCSWEDYTASLKRGDFDLYLGETRLTADFDCAPLLAKNGALNYGGFFSPALEEALVLAKKTGDFSAFYPQLQEESPWSVLCFKNHSILTRWGRVKGATPTPGNIFYDFSHWTVR